MKKILFSVIITSVIMVSGFMFYTSTSLNGKIDNRENGSVYLVNNSKTRSFKFTVKTTKVIQDTLFEYQTNTIELAPGDEVFLGKKMTALEDKNDYTVVRYNEDSLPILQRAPIDKNAVDKRVVYKYEVTGQTSINP